ncbi:uncharacterized protein LOC135383642 [Ornithodoros turicata]|uniref:uncharacterized protein LOC135383642 n=1 Tax=Ornithodoros turicata TaxID=34597 RepID=UPI00313961C1
MPRKNNPGEQEGADELKHTKKLKKSKKARDQDHRKKAPVSPASLQEPSERKQAMTGETDLTAAVSAQGSKHTNSEALQEADVAEPSKDTKAPLNAGAPSTNTIPHAEQKDQLLRPLATEARIHKKAARKRAEDGERNTTEESSYIPPSPPKRLFPDITCLAPEEAMEALRDDQGRSHWVASKESNLTAEGVRLASAIDRLSKKLEEDKEAGLAKQKTALGKDSPPVAKGPVEMPKTEKEHFHSPVLSPFIKLHARVFKGDTGENLHLSAREQFTVCASSVIFLLPVVIAVVIILRVKYVPSTAMDCGSGECSAVLQDLMSQMDHSVDPCSDFYSYVCGKTYDNSSFIKRTINAFIEHLNSTIMESPKIAPSDNYGMNVMFKLYRTCYDFMTDSSITFSQITNITSKFLDIDVVIASKDIADLMQQLVRISLSKGIFTTFSLQLRKNDTHTYMYFASETSILEKITAFSKLDDDLESFLSKVLEGTQGIDNVTTYARSLVERDKKVHDILKTPSESKHHSFEDLSQLLASSPAVLLGLVNMILLPERRVRSVHETVYAKGLQQAFAIRSLTMKGVILEWSLYYAAHLIATVLRYRDVRPTLPMTTARVCLGLTRNVLTHTWPYLVNNAVVSRKTPQKVSQIGNYLRMTIHSERMNSWLDDGTRRTMETTLNNFRIISYQDEDLKRLRGVSYATYSPVEDNFVTFYLGLKAFEALILQHAPPSEETFALSIHQLTSNLTFDETLNAIVIPAAYQSGLMIYVSDAIPFYFNYATLGVRMTREMIKGVGLPEAWTVATGRKIAAFVECIKRVRSTLGLHAVDSQQEYLWNVSAFAWTYAVHLSYGAVRHLIKERGESIFHSNWPTAQTIFFIRYCMMFCGDSQQADGVLIAKEQCLLPLRANPEFIHHYNCEEKEWYRQISCISSMFS